MKNFFMADSKLSMGRLLAMVSAFSGVAVGLILALNGKLDNAGVTLSLGLVGLGITGKVVTSIKDK